MAIPIRQQVITLEGTILGVVTDLTCTRCGQPYADLRVEPVSVTRKGIPAPFVAPTFGEGARREQVAGDLRAIVVDRESYGLDRRFGAIRCPHCLMGFWRMADPTSFKATGLMILGAILATLVGVAAFQLSKATSDQLPAAATDAGLRWGAVGFAATIVVFFVLSRRARREAFIKMDAPSAIAPRNAASPTQWSALKEAATALSVVPAALWAAEGSDAGSLSHGSPSARRKDVEAFLSTNNVLWILATRSASTPPPARPEWPPSEAS